jgi:hypothetical protein
MDNTSVIVRGAADLVYRKIAGQLSDYMGRIFEDICAQYLWKLLIKGNSPVEFASLGRWWGNDPRQRVMSNVDKLSHRLVTCLFGSDLKELYTLI